MAAEPNEPIVAPGIRRDRFWDRFTYETLRTENGYKAILSPTKGGSNTAWQGKKVKLSLLTHYTDGKADLRDLAVSVIDKIRTSRNSPFADITLTSLAQRLMDADASKVKDGGQWWENTPLSFIINELMKSVYLDADGLLPDEYVVNRRDLEIETIDGELGFWNLGVPPNWNGTTFTPSQNAHPVTATCTNPDGDIVYVGLGGQDSTMSPELWKYEPEEDLWTLLGKASSNPYSPIQSLMFNSYDDKLYGVMWTDVMGTASDMTDNPTTWFSPNARIFWWDSNGEIDSARLDDGDHSKTIGAEKFFPGQWDVREMESFTDETLLAGKTYSSNYDNHVVYKSTSNIGVGNESSHNITTINIPKIDDLGSGITGRAHPIYWPHVGKEADYPTLVTNGVSWTGTSEFVKPDDWTELEVSATYSVTANVLKIINGAGGAAGIQQTYSSLVPGYIYRLRVKSLDNGTGAARISVSTDSYGGDEAYSWYWDGGWAPIPAYTGGGAGTQDRDSYFEAVGTDIYIQIYNNNSTADQYIEIDEIELKLAEWYSSDDRNLNQPGESMALTSYSKIGIGIYSENVAGQYWANTAGEEADVFDFTGTHQRDNWVEVNVIAQDTKYYDDTNFYGGLYGRNFGEEGLILDNVFRESGVYDPLVGSTETDKAWVIDVGPLFNSVQNSDIGDADRHWEAEDFKTGRAGIGWVNISMPFIGLGGTSTGSIHPIQGIARWTNGQQGLFTLAQDADSGKGVIVFATSTSDTPISKFDWGHDDSGGTNKRFKISLQAFRCSTKGITALSAATTDWSKSSISNIPPWSESSTIYPTAACSDGTKVYIATQLANINSLKYTGSNPEEVTSPGSIYEVNLTTTWTASPSITEKYASASDASVYGTFTNSNVSTDYYGSAANITRKICWLHYNSNLTQTIQGWCFKKDSLLTKTAAPEVPCHEVFAWKPADGHVLTIVDHDNQVGTTFDSTGFVGFASATDRTWYFRLRKPTLNPSVYERIGRGALLNYYHEPSSVPIAGVYWDGETSAATSQELYGEEGFLGNRVGVVITETDITGVTREAVVSSFDNYMSFENLSDTNIESSRGSTQIFFKIDTKSVDRRVDLADFSDLMVWDAVTKLAQSENYIFGFDIDKFFLLPRVMDTTDVKTFDALRGEIIDVIKESDSEVRNVINVVPYTAKLGDPEWEITHVGGLDSSGVENSTKETNFNGELMVYVSTHREVTATFICVRPGRITDGDSGDSMATRTPVVLKWLVNNPFKSVVNIEVIGSSDTSIYLNTVYGDSDTPISIGDIIIFINQTTFKSIGRVIDGIDTDLNTVSIEEGPGFEIAKFTPLKVTSAHVGPFTAYPNANSNVKDIGKKYSDEGVAVITANDGGANITLTLNNINSFRGINPKTLIDDQYVFIATTLNAAFIKSASTAELFTDPLSDTTSRIAYVESIDIDNEQITLTTGVSYDGFQVGEILRLFYMLAPKDKDRGTEEPTIGITQDLPDDLGSWNWICEGGGTAATDGFNEGDIIKLKFPGMSLIGDEASQYTAVNTDSIGRWSTKPWTMPKNRFMDHTKAEYWSKKLLYTFGEPRLSLDVTVDLKPDLTFLAPSKKLMQKIQLTDHIMFPNLEGNKVTGYLRSLSMDLKGLITKFKLKSEEEY